MSETYRIAVFEWLACFLTLAASATLILRLRDGNRRKQIAVIGLCAVLPLIPINGLNVSQYFLTIIGHLSFMSMCLLTAAVIRAVSGKVLWNAGEQLSVMTIATASGLLLYLAAFGVLTFDLYQFGYDSPGLMIVIGVLTLATAVTGRNFAFAALITGAASFQLHLLASNNIWDYLIDPLLVIYAAGYLLVNAVQLIILHRRRATPENQ